MDFSRRERGEHLKNGIGGSAKGPAIRPRDTSLATFAAATPIFALTDRLLLHRWLDSCPV